MIETTGSCKCGEVQYRIATERLTAANCHCATCKKLSGSAFSAIALVNRSDHHFLKGEKSLTSYSISDKASKLFCRICGTPVLHVHQGFADRYIIPLGSLDDPAVVTPAINVFCESMLAWVGEISQLPGFDQLPPRG